MSTSVGTPSTAASQAPSQATTPTTKSDFLAAEDIKGILFGRDKMEQERIIRWVAESLGLATPSTAPLPLAHPATPSPSIPAHVAHQTPAPLASGRAKDIKAFAEEKQPRSDMQFAAVVAYYYRFETSEAHRKETITPQDLQEAARLAGRSRFRTPSVPLNNAVRQGYFDRADRGEFRLNAVGENLVAMALPGTGEDLNNHSRRARTRRARKKGESTRGGKKLKA